MSDDVIIIPSLLATISVILWMLLSVWQRQQHTKRLAEFNHRLLERISSVKDLSDFLQTEGGAKFMDALSSGTTGARERILGTVHSGIIFVTVGLGLIFIGARYASVQSHLGFSIFGIVVSSLGLGCLISAIASYGLAKALGLLNGNR